MASVRGLVLKHFLGVALGLSVLQGAAAAPGDKTTPPVSPGSTVTAPTASAEALRAVVTLHVTVPAEARSAQTLGRERKGNGVVIDSGGLIVTIGYLILEASSIEVMADGKRSRRDLRRLRPRDRLRPGARDPAARHQAAAARLVGARSPSVPPAVAASAGGVDEAQPVLVVSKRRFAGYWEYMLDEAIFTSPPIAEFGGAALIDPEGKLIGIGSLLVGDALKEPRYPGNMFVPIDLLKPIMADLMALGKPSTPPHPWIGITSQEAHGRLFIAKVTPEGPAEKAGLRAGDIILSIGDKPVESLAELYSAMWALGNAGVDVPVTVLRKSDKERITVKSIDRLTFLKTGITY